jgi:mannose-1-phosphate guanylyltransferase
MTSSVPRVTFVIMAGGRGERLWPLVRTNRPKVCLAPDGRRSLLRATVERFSSVWPRPEWLIVTTQEQAAAVRAALPAPMRQSVIVEPQAKNTAACITLSAVALAAQDPGRVMVAAPADHWVGQMPAFREAIRAAIRSAVAFDAIATIGIQPTHPHPGLGYLCAGQGLTAGSSGRGTQRPPRVFHLGRFVEKPSREAARRLLRRGRTYWNSGIFIGTAEKFLECITEWLPGHARALVPLAGRLHRQNGRIAGFASPAFARRSRAAYRTLEAVSFDRGVMDHVGDGLVVEGRFAWADLGSWDVWAKLARGRSRSVSVESRHVTVIGEPDHLIATVGVRNLLVIQTSSATLICRVDRAQSVREVVRRVSVDPALAAYR